MRFSLLTGCLLSLGVHAGVFLLLPAPSLHPFPSSTVPIEADLVALDVPLPPALQPPSPAADVKAASRSLPKVPQYEATKISPPDMQQINGAIEKLSAGSSMQLPFPALQLPLQKRLDDSLPPVSSPPSELSSITSAMLEHALRQPGLTTGVDKQVGWGQVRLGNKQSPSRLGLPQLDRRLLTQPAPSIPPLSLAPPTVPQFGIRGPVAKREPRYRPPLPKVRVRVESEITLKFWVRPDGVVSRVLPERKGDTALEAEAAAIRYLEGWRFTPLPPNEPQVEQWGTILVRFLPHKR